MMAGMGIRHLGKLYTEEFNEGQVSYLIIFSSGCCEISFSLFFFFY